MQYDKNISQKKRKLWEKVTQNKINISDLKKAGIKVKSLIYNKGIYKYQGEPTDEWQSAEVLFPTFSDITIYELKEFTEEMIPYLDSQLITKVAEDNRGNPNQELLEGLINYLDTQYGWFYTYVIKAEEDTTSAQLAYYLISYIRIGYWTEGNVHQTLNYKQVITINNLKFDEITKDNK